MIIIVFKTVSETNSTDEERFPLIEPAPAMKAAIRGLLFFTSKAHTASSIMRFNPWSSLALHSMNILEKNKYLEKLFLGLLKPMWIKFMQ